MLRVGAPLHRTPSPAVPGEVDQYPDEPRFCSDLCEDAYSESVELDQIYNEGRYSGAPAI